ncbi:uncharacterized protein CTRU02_202143 [Colletotrichum truncatum]|uniref:Uncharacterized protein n=1 Tax=Colletotrichum truncatum TaxID=5467 RepID=A0ACC3ZJG3_COLTU|nr:uncharacterized protein CTRU02_01305 [Colletotrichum truncatum]KAF6799626.1 hypothetical protein CTRU02_01305 [Colletotrichum truncatum]
MASDLPVELVELIFSNSSSSIETIKTLRLTCRAYANLGFPYLFKPCFTYLYWRGGDDARRLESWSRHARLRRLLRLLTINLSQMDEYTGRHSSFFQYWAMMPEDRDAVLRAGWGEYYDKEAGRKAAGSTFERDGVGLPAAMGMFEALENVRVVFNECPYENDVLRRAFSDPSSRRFEPAQAKETFELLTRMLAECVHLKRLDIDRFPMTMRPSVDIENLWGAFASSTGRRLEEIKLALDFSGLEGGELPGQTYSGWGESVGALLMDCWSVKKLAISKHYYTPLKARRRKTSRLNHLLLRDNPFQLTDLKLEGFAATGEELLSFVTRQVPTLRRLRLGGRGVANPREKSRGGIWLEEGTWFAFFSGLKEALREEKGVLERVHLEGDFGQADETEFEIDDHIQTVFETYDFYPTNNDEWEAVERPKWLSGSVAETALDGVVFEQYVLGDTMPYPGFFL